MTAASTRPRTSGTSQAAGYTALNNNLGVTQFYGGAGNAASGTIVGGTQDNGTLVQRAAAGHAVAAVARQRRRVRGVGSDRSVVFLRRR